MIKDGGYKVVQIDAKMLGDLAKSIKTNGSEHITLQSGVIEVVGFMITGNQTGDRVIILGDKTEGIENERITT